MNRRQFFKFAAPAIAVGALASELLWTPNRKFFLPPSGGWINHRYDDVWSIRQIKQYLITSDALPSRIECVYGWGYMQTSLADGWSPPSDVLLNKADIITIGAMA
jgi:hypothetical protein